MYALQIGRKQQGMGTGKEREQGDWVKRRVMEVMVRSPTRRVGVKTLPAAMILRYLCEALLTTLLHCAHRRSGDSLMQS